EGKSTTIKLLLVLFKPDSGQITIDGQPLSAYTQAVREGLFGTVFQEISKYDISVNDNIGLGDVSQIGNRELILEAAKKANLEKIIDKLPEKGATLLSREFTGGVDLSGGQWQRLAIARAFMGEKPLLILDEPTSQNDANCAALAELKFGAAKGIKDVIFMVLGTGVGGAIVIDGKIRHGQHLFGGELGFMLMDDTHSFSELGTAIGMANRYKARTGKDLTGEAIFNLAHAGEEIAQEEMTVFLFNVAKGIFNLAYAFDPECIVIGGGVSQAEWLIPELEKELQKMLNKFRIAPFLPVIKACQYRNDANLVGAAVDFQQTFKAKVSD
ncbi:MAG: ROK family protein, partial [Lactococcus raffinolactis]